MKKAIAILPLLWNVLAQANYNHRDPNCPPIRTQAEIIRDIEQLREVPLSYAYPWITVTKEQKEKLKREGK